MGALQKALVGLGVLVGGVVIVGFMLPDRAHVERATEIDSPPSTVFTLVNSYKSFNRWSPWAERDPNTQYTFEGPEEGVGARMSWKSDKSDVGSGSQEIILSEPFTRVNTRLDFGDGSISVAAFDIQPSGTGTRVTWGLDSEFGGNILGRYFGLMFDRMIGKDYEKGLSSLKSLAEALPRTDFSALKVETVELQPTTLAVMSMTTAPSSEAIGTGLATAYQTILAYMADQGLEQAGAPMSISRSEPTQDSYSFDAAIPVRPRSPDAPPAPEDPAAAVPAGDPTAAPAAAGASPSGEIPESDAVADPAEAASAAPAPPAVDISKVEQRQSYGGKALKVVHVGPYTEISKTMAALNAYMAARMLEPADSSFGEYVSDPGSTPEAQLITHLYAPIK